MSAQYSHVAHLSTSSFIPQPDLHPLYPTPLILSNQLSVSSTLTPAECTTLVNHSLIRACTFGDLALLTFILHDGKCNKWADLELKDEDNVTPIGICIMGFRPNDGDADLEREMEREECVRLLIKQGVELSTTDNSGWTPLHHAALLAPASLVSHMLSHGASSLALSRRKLTPLDVITAYEDVPGRAGAITLLREAMRTAMTYEEKQRMIKLGWRGDERREMERRKQEQAELRRHRKMRLKEDVISILDEELSNSQGKADVSWGMGNEDSEDEIFEPSDLEDEDSEGYDSDTLVTPPDSYRTMLVFSPPALARLFEALIPLPETQPTHRRLRDPLAAQALYLHCRFACIACDHNWLEDLIVGAMDRVEEVVMANPNDLGNLSHWLFNTTLLLHLLRCDESTAQICEILGLFGLMEELVNVVYVLVIRIIERRLDPLIDSALLDHIPPELQEEWDTLQFEGEWEGWSNLLGRVISPKKKPPPSASRPTTQSKMGPPSVVPSGSNASTLKGTSAFRTSGSMNSNGTAQGKPSGNPTSTANSTRPSSPNRNTGFHSASNSGTFDSIKNTLAKAAAGTITPSGSSTFLSTSESAGTSGKVTPSGISGGPSPANSMTTLAQKLSGGLKKGQSTPAGLTTLLTALHTFLCLSGINPVLIVQTFSQVMYWTACEMFNRILQRRKYLCRSRALHIGLNLGILEEWVSGTVGVGLPREVGGHFRIVRELVGWLQCLSSIDQFASLIATVQTFRHLNPLQMRRAVRDYKYEVGESKMTEECSQYLAQLQKDWERQRVKMGVEALKKEMSEREGSTSSRGAVDDPMSPPQSQSMSASNSSEFAAQRSIDDLFSRTFEKSDWQPAKPPVVLGELLDSRHMLPLLLPSDPLHLGALPVIPRERNTKRESDAKGFLTPGGLNVGGVGMPSGHDRPSHSRSGSQAGSRSASIASIGTRGSMEWLSRSRKLRVVDKSMLKHLGDDEVASELEAIAAKWKFAWDSSLAAGVPEIEGPEEGAEVVYAAEGQEEILKDLPEEARDTSPKLTHEPPRLSKEKRRRASQADAEGDFTD
ncbi:hypothetical protein M408DRAFT_271449 [Serendipita vermifera MAFF 305830]|uniref:Dilute domain-containing protein n=1 Tax=Serendipita vermifera MAFF 305830 TaxID=933852 RepID=A0A0C3B1Y8_SERVB|nr:hypothetical protein M408DRAFT_271449 [Serendipita vermifera MAFF 305830]